MKCNAVVRSKEMPFDTRITRNERRDRRSHIDRCRRQWTTLWLERTCWHIHSRLAKNKKTRPNTNESFRVAFLAFDGRMASDQRRNEDHLSRNKVECKWNWISSTFHFIWIEFVLATSFACCRFVIWIVRSFRQVSSIDAMWLFFLQLFSKLFLEIRNASHWRRLTSEREYYQNEQCADWSWQSTDHFAFVDENFVSHSNNLLCSIKSEGSVMRCAPNIANEMLLLFFSFSIALQYFA